MRGVCAAAYFPLVSLGAAPGLAAEVSVAEPFGLSWFVAPKSPAMLNHQLLKNSPPISGRMRAQEQRGLERGVGDAGARVAVEIDLRAALQIEPEVVTLVAQVKHAVVPAGERVAVITRARRWSWEEERPALRGRAASQRQVAAGPRWAPAPVPREPWQAVPRGLQPAGKGGASTACAETNDVRASSKASPPKVRAYRMNFSNRF